jgi:hypothetical protein
MKILGLLLQSKKGDPLIISTSPSVLNRKIILYSNVIYENILETYRNFYWKIRKEIKNIKMHPALTKPYLCGEHNKGLYFICICIKMGAQYRV